MGTARLLSVNVVHAVTQGYWADTAIDKRPVAGVARIGELGVEGDRQLASSHGGPDKAVYAYAQEDADWWADELGRAFGPGLVGENLRTSGVDVSGALIGEQWRIGDVLLEVRQPRTPCKNLSARLGLEGFHLRFNRTGRVGALCRVLETGTLRAGDPVEVGERPDHDLTIADLARGPDPEQMRRLLDSGVPLAANVRAKARRMVKRLDS